MDLRREVSVGDYVQYVDGSGVVCSQVTGFPMKVTKIAIRNRVPCVIYESGEFDYLQSVEKCCSLLLELC
jgi:hypothetical protein